MRGARKIEIAELKVRNEASRGGNDDIGALGEGLSFLFEADAVVSAVDSDAVRARVVGKTLQGLVDLLRQFACGRHDEAVHSVVRMRLIAQNGEHREEIGRGLAGSGLCDANEVFAFEEMGDATCLYGSAFFETHVPKCVEHVFAQGEVFKIDGFIGGRFCGVFGRNL